MTPPKPPNLKNINKKFSYNTLYIRQTRSQSKSPDSVSQPTYSAMAKTNLKKDKTSSSSHSLHNVVELSDEETDAMRSPMQQHIRNLKSTINNLLSDALDHGGKNQSKLQKQYSLHLDAIQDIHTQQTQSIERLSIQLECANEQIQFMKNQIDNLTDKIPSTSNLLKAMEEQIANQLKQQLLDMAALDNDESSDLVPPQEETMEGNDIRSSAEHQSTSNQNRSKPQFKDHQEPESRNQVNRVTQDPARRTAIVKARNPSTGAEIMAALATISVTAGLIESVVPKSRTVHITCRTNAKRETLKRDLQLNKHFNRTMNIVNLPLDTARILIRDVPEEITKENIIESVKMNHNVRDGEINIIASLKSKRGGLNHIAVVPVDVARDLVSARTTVIGLTPVSISPHTSIKRCKKCGLIGHLEKQCTACKLCNHCSEAHFIPENPEPCTRQAKCINCVKYNRDNNAKLQTNHPISSRDCPSYNEAYQAERERINQLFGIHFKKGQPSAPEDLMEEHRQIPGHSPRRVLLPEVHHFHQEARYGGSYRTAYPYGPPSRSYF